ncbi:ATR-interacting protein isoform X5 [Aquila chrysaetos chrysaetos]|uniref:ATR-interacting protein isoform X5 n=1 Tax=Aquila chrysaetos chrysaetos TaxID=223781 RepID=UPI001B7D2F25|nr:ATR-interacting protein isoform X5 [Aquila chrysaetos chrysaetos]
MAAQPPLGPRKRSGPAPCAAGWAWAGSGSAPPAAAGRSGGALENGFPPHKRPKSSGAAGPEEGPADPFGDNDDFTADDLEEIDILASQALSQEAAAAALPRHAWAAFGASGAERRAAAGQPRGIAPAAGRRPKAGSSTEDSLMRDAFQFEVLQTQHEEIKQKLKEMQDEILTKNGEIKILRDSMQQMEYAMEEQKRSYMLLEQQKTQTLSEKEKEFSKKLLSLQSELQFKDAEMNELRTRLQNCERNKHVTQTVLMPSPKKNLAIQLKSEGCSPQPGKRSFPTKESFNAEMSTRPSCSSGNLIAPPTLIKEDSKITHPEVLSMKHEAMGKNGSYNSVPKRNARGSILLNALMKQPIVPGSLLGLCHLLSSNSEPPPGAVLQPNYLDTFQHLLSSQILFRCLCPETPLPAVLLTVRLLCILAQHHMLVAQLCSHSDTCLLLALYMYITSRPDKSASEMLWLQLEQETVRLLTRCMRCSSPAVLLPGTDCQCNLEVVKALIIMLHRQWMKIRRSENSLSAYKEQIIQFLRDAVLLLHSLSQKDKLFHEHCLEVLHQYDQAMPGVRAILKKTQKLSACEELILDELYPPEPEAEDQGMDSS